MDTTYTVFACYSKVCAPPPAGRGGSAPRKKMSTSVGAGLREPDSGFTLSTKLNPVKKGFAVALKGSDRLLDARDAYMPDGSVNPRLRSLIRDRLSAAMGTQAPPGTRVAIGGWHNPADGKLEVNVTVVFPPGRQRDAERFARKNDQISMARLHDPFKIIDTGGTGGDRSVTAAAVLKDPRGGLTPAGRKAFGGNLKPGVKNYDAASDADKRRWISWARRFYARGTFPAFVDADGNPTRFALTARAWGEPIPKNASDARKIAAKAAERKMRLDGKV